MKTDMLKILKRLESDEITYKEARKELWDLFGLSYKTKYRGRAIVKNKDYRYYGLELEIIGLSFIHKNGNGVFQDGTREFKLSLKNTEWEKEQSYTVLPETYLEILELYED